LRVNDLKHDVFNRFIIFSLILFVWFFLVILLPFTAAQLVEYLLSNDAVLSSIALVIFAAMFFGVLYVWFLLAKIYVNKRIQVLRKEVD